MKQRVVACRERGMCTTEYALGTIAACGFACILMALLQHWRGMLMQILIKGFDAKFGWPDLPLPW